MAYIRNIKATFFTSADTMALSPLARLLYIGLWCEADREGRLRWRPASFKVRYLPTDDCDIEAVCGELTGRALVVRYEDEAYGDLAVIPTFRVHQRPNNKEAASVLPEPVHAWHESRHASKTRESRVREGKEREGKEREGESEGARASVVRMDNQWGTLPTRRKLHCAFESAIGLDVPQFLHDEFAARLTNAGTTNADAALHAWYGATEAAYKGRPVGEDALRFWRARFAEWQGVTAKAAPVADDGWMPPVRKGAR